MTAESSDEEAKRLGSIGLHLTHKTLPEWPSNRVVSLLVEKGFVMGHILIEESRPPVARSVPVQLKEILNIGIFLCSLSPSNYQ